MKYIKLTLIFIVFVIIQSATGLALNPQCLAIAKSTGNQCRNRMWSDCTLGTYCFQHCK